jgi:hypothetical protein
VGNEWRRVEDSTVFAGLGATGAGFPNFFPTLTPRFLAEFVFSLFNKYFIISNKKQVICLKKKII